MRSMVDTPLKVGGILVQNERGPGRMPEAVVFPGSGGKGTRTPDLIHAMDALYQN